MGVSRSRAGRLDEAAIAYLARDGAEVEHPRGALVIRRGALGEALYVVLEGEVEVRLEADDGRRLGLCRMGAGSTFGELSILTGTPVSADVVATTPVRVLRYPAQGFAAALAECASLRRTLLTRLAGDLQRTTADAWTFFQRSEALASLARAEKGDAPMVTVSARMRALADRADRLAAGSSPMLLSGAPGTGKLFLALRVHRRSPRADGPSVVVDCRRLRAEGTTDLLFGVGDVEAGDRHPEAVGALHLAHGGTLVLRHVDALEGERQALLVSYLARRAADPGGCFPDARVIAIARETVAGELPESLAPELVAELGEAIRLPTLAERPRDVVPLARAFLSEVEGGGGLELDESALRALASMPFRRRNLAELREVVEQAAYCVDGDEIRAEHVFPATGEDEALSGVDVGKLALVRRLVGGGWLPALRSITFAGFVAAIGLCLLAPSSGPARAANAFVWSGWEPVVFALFLLAGPVWCTVCPLSTAGRCAQRGFSLGRQPPPLMRSSAPLVAAVGFFLIVWAERIFALITLAGARPGKALGWRWALVLVALALYVAGTVALVV